MFYYFISLDLVTILKKKCSWRLCPISRTCPGYRTIIAPNFSNIIENDIMLAP